MLVFNCALNPAMKKKKLPSVVPPPPPAVVQGKVERPFWKEPLPEYSQLEWNNQETPKDIEQKLMVSFELISQQFIVHKVNGFLFRSNVKIS